MPGNEGGDRVHNFFDQSSLSQDQRNTQFVEANWSNAWGANERQNDGSLNTNSKNNSGQQSEIETGQNSQFSLTSHGLSFTQSNVKNPSQVQQLNLNGFMHTPQAVTTRQNEANFLGVDRGSDRHSMTSRGLSFLESQQRSMPQHNNSASFGGPGTPMNFNFLGGQSQMNIQQPGMLQSFPPQQSGTNDAQIMQQQVMFKQMQELQRRQQLQQFEAMQRNAMNHMPTFPNQSAGQHSQPINGNPVHDTSNYSWQPQVMGGATNWQQHGQPSAVQGYTNGGMAHSEQGQSMRFMGLVPQQASQSLYGIPVSNSVDPNPYSQNSMDKPGVFHIPSPSGTFSGNPYTPHAEHVNRQDASRASRSGSEGNTSFEHVSSQGLENAVGVRGFNQVQQSKMSMSGGGRRGFVAGSEEPPENSPVHAAASQSTSAQAASGLDPSEEKFLFGNDGNIWDAFGEASATGSDGTDILNKAPSVQNGTWSALMQSALAETSSGDAGTQDEWNGLESQNSQSLSRSQHLPVSQDNEEKPTPVWVDSSERDLLGSRTTNNDMSGSIATLVPNYSHNTNLQHPFSNLRSSPIESQEGRRWLDSNSPKQHTGENRVLENHNSSRDAKVDTGFWNRQQSAFLPQSVSDPNINLKVEPGLRNVNMNNELSQRPPDNHSRDLWNQINFASKSGNVGSGNAQHNMSKGQSAINSLVNTTGGRVAEMEGIQNGDGRENSSDSRQDTFPNRHASPGFSNENVLSDAGRGVPVSRKFQFHPMGDVDLSSKDALNSRSMSPSSGFKVHEAQPPLFGSRVSSLSNMEKDRVSGFHGGLSSNAYSGYSPNLSAPFARSGEKSFANQQPPSQNMLELLHKVDQSTDQNAVFNLGSSTPHHTGSPDIPSVGQIGAAGSQPSTSHSFNLQLAPPSQGINFSNHSDSASRPQLVSSDKGDNSNAWLATEPSAHFLPHSNRPPQMDSKDDKSRVVDSSLSNMKGSSSAPMTSNSTYLRTPFQNQCMPGSGGQMMEHHQSSTVSSERNAYQDQQSTTDHQQSSMRPPMHQSQPSLHDGLGGMGKGNVSLNELYSRTSQQPSGVQARNPPNFIKSHVQSNDSQDMNALSQKKKDDMDGSRSVNAGSSPVVADSVFGKTAGVSREESINMAYNSYLHEMQATQTMGMEPDYRESKRLRGPENGSAVLQIDRKVAEPSTGGMHGMVTDPSFSQTHAKLLSFNSQIGTRNISQLPHGALASRDTPSFDRSDPQTQFTGRPQLTGISQQMASAWFQHYGALPNGQLLPEHNVPRVKMEDNVQQKFIQSPSNLFPQNPVQPENAITNTFPTANTGQMNTYSANEDMSSLHALIPHVSSPNPVHVRPKKRKTATSDLIPWNKEIGEAFKRIQNISSAEFDWAQSSDRLVERGGDESDPHEDMSAMITPRRRLILTTKFMQQIFCPPPASILSLDARSNYEVIMYSIARLALGDACNLICGLESDSPPDNGNTLSRKGESVKRIRDQKFSQIVEAFTNKAKQLDTEFLRLDKRASILDFRLDCQDLERFSVINRFAKFHGRSQADGAESSSSSDTNAVSQKPCQRYVTAHPMPKTFPERVQCLTL